MSSDYIYHIHQIYDAAQLLIDRTQHTNIVAFHGEMGAGKTTLIQAICKQKGVHEPATSPTYSIVNEYLTNTGTTIYHFDFYRLQTLQEALDMGVYEYLDSGNLCLIEWPERIKDILEQEKVLYISIKKTSETERNIQFS